MGSLEDDLFADYMQHLTSWPSGNKAYAAPQTTTIQTWPQQGGVLGACKTNSAGNMSNPGHQCLITCASIGS